MHLTDPKLNMFCVCWVTLKDFLHPPVTVPVDLYSDIENGKDYNFDSYSTVSMSKYQ